MKTELILSLKELVSVGLRKLEANTHSVFTGIDKRAAATDSKIGVVKRDVQGLGKSLDDLKRTRELHVDASQVNRARHDVERLEREMGAVSRKGMRPGGGGSGFSGMAAASFVGNFAAQGVMQGLGAAKQVAGDSIQAGMDFGMTEKSFEVLTRNAARGRELAGELRRMKQTTLVGAGVYGNAQTMLGFGVNDKDVVRKLREVGDVGMGDTERMQSLTLARSQVTAAGKLAGQDLMQFVNAGFNPLSVMSENWQEFGLKAKATVGELKDMMSEGKITADMVDKAFEIATSKGGQFYQMMEQIGKTEGGKALKYKGEMAATKIDLGIALAPYKNRLYELFRQDIKDLPAVFKRLEPIMERAFTQFADIMPSLKEFGGDVMGLLAPVKDLLLSDEIKNLAKDVLDFGGLVAKGLKPAVDIAVTSLKNLSDTVSSVYAVFKGILESKAMKDSWRFWHRYEDQDEMGYLFAQAEAKRQMEETIAAIQLKDAGLSNFKGGKLPGMPKSAYGGALPSLVVKAAAAVASPAQKDAITGGGRKTVNIYLNRPMVEKQIFQVGSMREAMEVSLNEFKQNYLRVIQSAMAAL